MSTPREPERAKNGGANVPVKASKSLVAAATVSQSTDDMVKWWRAFRRFMRDVEDLREYYEDLCEERVGRGDPPRMPGDLEQDAEWCQELTAKCKAGFERFDRRDNYEQDGDDVQHVLK